MGSGCDAAPANLDAEAPTLTHHHSNPGGPFLASLSLSGIAAHLAQAGLSWETAAAVIGALGTFLIGVSGVLREMRLRRDPAARP